MSSEQITSHAFLPVKDHPDDDECTAVDPVDGECPHPRGYAARAQAIIDELGLRVEGQMGAYGDDPIWEERVVGKWEAEQ